MKLINGGADPAECLQIRELTSQKNQGQDEVEKYEGWCIRRGLNVVADWIERYCTEPRRKDMMISIGINLMILGITEDYDSREEQRIYEVLRESVAKKLEELSKKEKS